MDSRAEADLIHPVYEDFDPPAEVVLETECHTILLTLPGFRKDHLKVQLTTSKILRISGSRQIEVNKWKRFQKEFPVSPDRDTQKITAKFEGAILYVRIPKFTPPLEKKEAKQDTKLPAITPQEPSSQKSPSQEQDTAKDIDSTKQTNAQDVTEDLNVSKEKIVKPIDSEKKAKSSPEEIASGLDESKKTIDKREDEKAKKFPEEKHIGLDDSKTKSIAGGDKVEDDDKVKKYPEEKNRGLDVSKQKDEGEDESMKATEKREKESSGTLDGSDKARDENYKETAEHHFASKLLKHLKMFNFCLAVFLAIALGIYITNFRKSLKGSEN